MLKHRLSWTATAREQIELERNSFINLFKGSLTDVSTGILILRLLLGVVFFAHGAQKVFGWFGGYGLDATVDSFAKMGIPAVLAYVASFTEFLGGLSMITGFLTRIFAVGLTINMIVAMTLVHLKNGFFGPNGIEFTLTLAVVALTIFLLGPGVYSLDNQFFKEKK